MEVEEKVRILWVSRHPIVPIQKTALEEKLGPIEVHHFSERVPSAEWLYENVIKPGNYRYVVPVLPLSFIARLSEVAKKNGFTLLWSSMDLLHNDEQPACPDFNPDTDTMVAGYDAGGKKIYRHYRFNKFKVIKEVKLVLEDF